MVTQVLLVPRMVRVESLTALGLELHASLGTATESGVHSSKGRYIRNKDYNRTDFEFPATLLR